jgi:serine phosphatase RsbU (regulator of sigma subunit)
MFSRRYWLSLLFLFAVLPVLAERKPEPLIVTELGKGVVALDGPWQFHLGDDPGWAAPEIDDSHWEQLTAYLPWDAQGHWGYDGFAWYRRSIAIVPRLAAAEEVSVLVPATGDAYEVYWNGALVGRSGNLPPHPKWYADSSTAVRLGPAVRGVLAIRVWRAPFLSIGLNDLGGLRGPPLAGLPEEISAHRRASYDAGFRFDVSYFILLPLYVLAALLGLLPWLGDRSKSAYLWMSCFSIAMLVMLVASTPIAWSWTVPLLLSINRVGIGIRDIALLYMLLWLLDLRSMHRLRRVTDVVARGTVVVVALYAFLLMVGWPSPEPWARLTQSVESFLPALYAFPGVLALMIVAIALVRRKRLNTSRWLLAIATLITELLILARNMSIVGLRFTHWTLIGKLLNPLAVIHGVAIHPHTVTDTLVLAALVYAFYRDSVENRRRQETLEQEFRNARELQQVLIPEALPEVPGYAFTSAYRPALEVGGDFFQIIALADSSTLVVLGDVSGKGLKAAMAVSLIVGVVRALADDYPEPARLLEQINRRLCGRLQGGFATCIALRLYPDGRCDMATAGHPSPFLNDAELELPGAFPLGLSLMATYEEVRIQLDASDHLSLYTDGLLEARSSSGELYSFERLSTLLTSRPTAEQATEAAVAFGQDDDITVLTLTRLALECLPAPQ